MSCHPYARVDARKGFGRLSNSITVGFLLINQLPLLCLVQRVTLAINTAEMFLSASLLHFKSNCSTELKPSPIATGRAEVSTGCQVSCSSGGKHWPLELELITGCGSTGEFLLTWHTRHCDECFYWRDSEIKLIIKETSQFTPKQDVSVCSFKNKIIYKNDLRVKIWKVLQ